MMLLRRWVLVTVLAVSAAFTGSAHTSTGQTTAVQKAEGIEKLRLWFALARTHRAGEIDAPINFIRSLTPDDFCRVQAEFASFFKFVWEWNNLPVGRKRTVPHTAEEKILAAMADKETSAGADSSLLRQLALLHSDAVVLPGGLPYATDGGSSCVAKSAIIVTIDGVRVGDATTSPHWSIARAALRVMSNREKATDSWVRQWYQATTAWLFMAHQLASIPDHLASWNVDVPKDVEWVFAQGCLFEGYANERVQQILDNARPGDDYHLPPRRKALERARDFFEAVVAQKSDYVEARLRLNRTRSLLNDRQRLTDGIAEMLAHVEGDSELRYLGFLLLGGWLQSSNDTDAAASAYEEAARLYPKAQSPAIALVLLRPQSIDAGPQLESVLRVSPGARYDLFNSSQPQADPWFRYHLGPGRRADALLKLLWQATKRD